MISRDEGINVIIPMAGLGSRFSAGGFTEPKPLVPILGRPMLSWLLGNLHFGRNDMLYIALQKSLDDRHAVCNWLSHELQGRVAVQFIVLPTLTRGAAETLYEVTKGMGKDRLGLRTISLDCDTLYFTDVLTLFRELDNGWGCCMYFHDEGDKPIFSYIALDGSGFITDIKEKSAISRNANTGAYGFPSANDMNIYADRMLSIVEEASIIHVPPHGNATAPAKELYTSTLIADMLHDGVRFKGIHVAKLECVGTPVQLVSFFHRIAASKRTDDIQVDKVQIWVDLDPVVERLGVSHDAVATWGDKDVLEALGDGAGQVLKNWLDHPNRAKLMNVGVSLSSGRGAVKKKSSDVAVDNNIMRFASVEERVLAIMEHRLVRVDDDGVSTGPIEKSIGWYLH